MDSDQTYSHKYIWKYTTQNGMLPITNLTEEVQEEGNKKRGKTNDKGKEIGQITNFSSNSDEESQKTKQLSNGMYVYVNSLSKYGIIKSKKPENVLLLRVRKPNAKEEYDEIEVTNSTEEILLEVEVSVRVIMSEDKKFSIIL